MNKKSIQRSFSIPPEESKMLLENLKSAGISKQKFAEIVITAINTTEAVLNLFGSKYLVQIKVSEAETSNR